MILKNWKRHNKYYDFDETKNRIKKTFIEENENIKINGFLSFEKSMIGFKRIFCVYSQYDELFFLAGKNKWKIDNEHSTIFKQKFFYSSFTLLHKRSKIYEFKYLTIFRTLFVIIDPTYDFIDSESDNFIFYFSNLIDSIQKDKKHLKEFIKHLS